MTCAGDAGAVDGQIADFSLLDWSCRKLPRVARSSLAAEAQAASIAEGELFFLRLAFAELNGTVIDLDRANEIVQNGTPATMITDCKALYDAELKSETAGLGVADRRCSIEILGLKQSVMATGTRIRWVHSHAQIADGLTKASLQALQLLTKFMHTQRWRLVFDAKYMSARKRAAINKDIFDEIEDGDPEQAKDTIAARRQLRERVESIRKMQEQA